MLLVISKRRSQLRQVIATSVRQVMGYLDDTPDVETKTAVIKTLLDLTEGKVRARGLRRPAPLLERPSCGLPVGAPVGVAPAAVARGEASRRPDSGLIPLCHGFPLSRCTWRLSGPG